MKLKNLIFVFCIILNYYTILAAPSAGNIFYIHKQDYDISNFSVESLSIFSIDDDANEA